MSSKIEWTEDTWNPLIGCDKISAGCKNCYAIKTAWIRQHNSKMAEKYAGVVEKTSNGSLNWTGKINFHQPSLLKPLNTKKPTMFFVNSMSDLFHEDVPFEYIDAIFSVMSDCDWHTYQVLTKRAKRLYEFYQWKREQFNIPWQPKNNVWIGVSVEDQKAANERIPYLLQIPAAVRFLSCEPLLGPVNLTHIDADGAGHPEYCQIDCLTGRHTDMARPCEDVETIDWVIVGGESGKDARPMHPAWVRSLKDQCEKANVPFFFKQWGEWYTRWADLRDKSEHPFVFKYYDSYQQFTQKDWVNKGDACISIDGTVCKTGGDMQKCAYPVAIMQKVGKKKAGRLLDGKEYNEFPNQFSIQNQ